MKVINILPPAIYNRLAAGEVVENPASIVKELIENSLDAKAKKITVQIVNGGMDEIVVIDDGEGVDENNIDKVLMPHATSKIAQASDIDHITSLGFRGEAMASIAAVAKVEFISKPSQQNYAVSINEKNEKKMLGGNNGTLVRVTDLFYNTPARKKFLRSATVERNNVTTVIHGLIFAQPHLHLRYVVDGKVILDYAGQGLATAMTKIFGVADTALLAVDYQEPGIAVSGYLTNPHCTKNNKERQVIIINGRLVNGGLPAAVVNQVMMNYLPQKTYAIFVLHLTIATEAVDVNVHPQKKEVRFDNKEKITQVISKAMARTVEQYFLTQIEALAQPAVTPTSVVTPQPAKVMPKVSGKSFTPEQTTAETVILQSLNILNDQSAATVQSAPNILSEIEIQQAPTMTEQTTMLPTDAFTILGQIFETYLLVRTADNLVIIDQHAMAERINYDKFSQQIDAGNIQSQYLLAPTIMKITPQELSKFEQIKPTLLHYGFDCDWFGESAIRISAVPAMMVGSNVADFLTELCSDKTVVSTNLSETLKYKVATFACKASLKAGQLLTNEQIAVFLNHYLSTKNLPLCPHGRPIMLTFSRAKLESLFARK